MVHENYNLTWHTYSDHLKDMMQEIFRSDDFKDVTLVSDDKQSIKAHRNILSTCSPVFKSILQMEGQNNHPVIYLKGIKYSEIEAILKFIYTGETKCNEKELNELLLTAQNLEIKELCENVNIQVEAQVDVDKKDEAKLLDALIEDSIETKSVGYSDKNKGKEDQPVEEISHKIETVESVQGNEGQMPEEEDAPISPTPKTMQSKQRNYGLNALKVKCSKCEKYFANKWVLDRHIKSLHEGITHACNYDQCYHEYTEAKALKNHIRSVHEGVKFPCKQCDKQFNTKNLLNIHSKNVHEGIKHQCNYCDLQFTLPSSLTIHIQSVHKGVTYDCDQCDYKALLNRRLKEHIQSIHEGVTYDCDQCDYKALHNRRLKEHIQSIHEGVTYDCDQCDYKALHNRRLREHIQSIHEGVRYTCNQCDYKATRKDTLKMHIQRIHPTIKFDPKMYEIKLNNL